MHMQPCSIVELQGHAGAISERARVRSLHEQVRRSNSQVDPQARHVYIRRAKDAVVLAEQLSGRSGRSVVPRLRVCEPYFGVARCGASGSHLPSSGLRRAQRRLPGSTGDAAPFLHPSLSLSVVLSTPKPTIALPHSLQEHCTRPASRLTHRLRPRPHPLAWRGLAILISDYAVQTGSFWPIMTTPSLDQPSTTAQSIPQAAALVSQTEPDHDTLPSSAVEMKTLQSPAGASDTANTTTSESGAPQLAPVNFTSVGDLNPSESTQAAAAPSLAPPPRNELNRTETEAALGPSTDGPAANPDNSNGPTVVIMLLLTTGARHPYKIDEKYLKKRNVTVEEMDPYNISVYTLKELIWRDWREGTFCAVHTPLSLSSRTRQLLSTAFIFVLIIPMQSRYRVRNDTRSDDLFVHTVFPLSAHMYLNTATPASPAVCIVLLTRFGRMGTQTNITKLNKTDSFRSHVGRQVSPERYVLFAV